MNKVFFENNFIIPKIAPIEGQEKTVIPFPISWRIVFPRYG